MPWHRLEVGSTPPEARPPKIETCPRWGANGHFDASSACWAGTEGGVVWRRLVGAHPQPAAIPEQQLQAIVSCVRRQENVPAQWIARQPVARQTVESFDALAHVGGPGCQVDPHGRTPTERDQTGSSRLTNCCSVWVSNPRPISIRRPSFSTTAKPLASAGCAPERSTVSHARGRRFHPASASAASGTAPVSTKPAHAPDKTPPGSSRWFRSRRPTARPPPGSGAAAAFPLLPQSSLHFNTGSPA